VTLDRMALLLPMCLVLRTVVRCVRDLSVLRSLERLLRGCDQQERVEVCRILAASLHAAGRPGLRGGLPPANQ
jgi:hypothetical protein